MVLAEIDALFLGGKETSDLGRDVMGEGSIFDCQGDVARREEWYEGGMFDIEEGFCGDGITSNIELGVPG